jgi:hypothetical protein
MSRSSNKIIRRAIIFGILSISLTLNAQKIDFFGGVGYGSYSYKELKDYQSYLVKISGIDATIVDEFPPYYAYLFGINFRFTKWTIGIEAGHSSTGGRVYYEDYSGKLIQDQAITYNYVGASPAFYIFNSKGLQITGGLKFLMIRHILAIKNSLVIGSQASYESKDFYGLNLGIQPNVTLRKYIGAFLFQGSAGYEFQNSSYPETKDDNLFLNDGSNNPVHLQGNGYRVSLCVGFTFGSIK